MHETETASLRWSRRDAVLLLGLAGAAFVFVCSLARHPWFTSHEALHQLTRLFEMTEALRGGQFPVRWCDNLEGGWGFPFFNFYSPFAFYVAGLFHLAGLSLTGAWKVEFALMAWLAALGMYGLLRARAGRRGAVAGAMLYLFAPYHAVTLFVRGNAAEFTALCLWPLAFWGVEAVARNRSRVAIPVAALAIGALASSHSLTTYMAAWNLAAWGLFLLFAEGERTPRAVAARTLRLGATAFLGAAVAAFYIVPSVTHVQYVNTQVLYERTHFYDHFPTFKQLLLPHWGFGPSRPGPDDEMDFHVGLALVGGLLLAAWYLVWRFVRKSSTSPLASVPNTTARIMFGFVITAFHALLMLEISRPMWGLFPASAYLQFPWRLLIPTTFWAATTIGWTIGALSNPAREGQRRNAWWAAVLLVPVLPVTPYLQPGGPVDNVPPYIAEQLRLSVIDTAEGEYLPRWVEAPPTGASPRRLIWRSGDGDAQLLESASAWYRFDVSAKQTGVVSFEQIYFPGWRAIIDGVEVEAFPYQRDGLVSCEIPTGASDVIVELRETPVRRAADAATLVALITAAGWIGWVFVRRSTRQ